MSSADFSLDFPMLSPLCGGLALSATFRERPDDFYVEENLGFTLSGDGEHCCLYIEKCGQNTHWVAAELARFVGVSERDVGVCGRKDRHAITRQWFSVYDPERSPVDWSAFAVEGVSILRVTRHHKKLRLGMHESNQFVIRLRDVESSSAVLGEGDKQAVLNGINDTLEGGIPNYFGVQRFGREAGNLRMAQQWLVDGKKPPRQQKGMVLSAARSYLFNQVLAARVTANNWQAPLDGDVLIDGLPSGPLWGRGRLASQGSVLDIEQQVLLPFTAWCERLEHQGLKQERRSLVLLPRQVAVQWEDEDLVLAFTLPVGTFATAVLTEISQLKLAA